MYNQEKCVEDIETMSQSTDSITYMSCIGKEVYEALSVFKFEISSKCLGFVACITIIILVIALKCGKSGDGNLYVNMGKDKNNSNNNKELLEAIKAIGEQLNDGRRNSQMMMLGANG